MTCQRFVYQRMAFTNYRTIPPEVEMRAMRFRVVHDATCNGNCTPEDVEMRAEDWPPTLDQLTSGKRWDFRMLSMAQLVATWSRDPSTKVGAVIMRPDKTVLSLGFNGFPRGCSDAPHLYEDRTRKYERVVHAELNAILTATERPVGCTLYVWPPAPIAPGTCARCAAAIIQAGITRVVCVLKPAEQEFAERWANSYWEAGAMYREAGVATHSYRAEEYGDWLTKAAFALLSSTPSDR